MRSTLQIVHRCNLGNTGEFLCFSEWLLMFGCVLLPAEVLGTDADVTLWWKCTNPCREPTKRGCCISFSSAKVCPEMDCVCACVCACVGACAWRGHGASFQLSYWNYTGSHCITGESLNHSFRRAPSLADFDTALTQCIQLTHFNDHVAN